jgi:hypothetical protein
MFSESILEKPRSKKVLSSKPELDYDDLNDCVEALLKKSKGDSANNRDVKRRQRKNKDQVKILENEYKKNPNWTRDFIKRISDELGLRES